ncbi:uncharacterized protein CLUP02_04515 [Colletotrichum lupini]|uniref:Uncharacterized protein n=1 Tax=Colletotrichum lupini TaxID=145971 RepID=A0A9Q8SKG4_9PEZI|nr:uncharacterized protein CLUP02_04515 [Colletotrichum lupini]UQC79036.1 hypothetical protein CLUP02_04515 [Colletotrichum lupini]
MFISSKRNDVTTSFPFIAGDYTIHLRYPLVYRLICRARSFDRVPFYMASRERLETPKMSPRPISRLLYPTLSHEPPSQKRLPGAVPIERPRRRRSDCFQTGTPHHLRRQINVHNRIGSPSCHRQSFGNIEISIDSNR